LEILIYDWIRERHLQFSNFVGNGYHGAISKSRNFSGWQKKHTKLENEGNWGNDKTVLLDFAIIYCRIFLGAF